MFVVVSSKSMWLYVDAVIDTPVQTQIVVELGICHTYEFFDILFLHCFRKCQVNLIYQGCIYRRKSPLNKQNCRKLKVVVGKWLNTLARVRSNIV